jgi:CrcB protein
MNLLFGIFIGGGLGSLLRYYLSRYNEIGSIGFPYGTFFANLSACLFLGCILGIQQRYQLSNNVLAALLIGLCGGFSTFSTFGLETLRMLEKNNILLAISYVVLSSTFSIILIYLGRKGIIMVL